jgi:hypothetical protein
VFSAFCNQVPHRLPRAPDLLCSSARARGSCRRPPPSTYCSAPRSTRRPVPPPTARVVLAGRPSLFHVGQTPRAAATPPRQARRRRPPLCAWPHDLPLPFLLSNKPCIATKPDRAPSPRLLCLFLLPTTPSRCRSSSPGFSSTASPRPNSLSLSLPHLLP